MKAIIYSLAALAAASTLFVSIRPADARGASVVNSTTNNVMVEEFSARGHTEIHLRPQERRNLRATTVNIVAEMIPRGRIGVQCGPMRRAGGTLRVVAVGRDSCRIQP